MGNIRRNGADVEQEQFAASGWRNSNSSRGDKHFRAAMNLVHCKRLREQAIRSALQLVADKAAQVRITQAAKRRNVFG